MTNMNNMTKLEILAAKLYCIRTAGNYNFPVELDDLVKQMGREVALIPFVPDCNGQGADRSRWVAVSRAELDYIHKALEDALATPSEELLPDSVTHAEAMLFKILTRIVSKSVWNANESNENANEN